jgi:hypothetical protein
MGRLARCLCLTTLFVAARAGAQQPPARVSGSAATVLADLERRMLAAEVTGNREFFRRLELCSFRFVGWYGEQLTKTEDLAAVSKPRRGRVVAFGVDEIVIKEYGTTAVVWGLDTVVTHEPDGRTTVRRSRFTHVYLWRSSRWRLAAAHASPARR